jgi:hypothetical protein
MAIPATHPPAAGQSGSRLAERAAAPESRPSGAAAVGIQCGGRGRPILRLGAARGEGRMTHPPARRGGGSARELKLRPVAVAAERGSSSSGPAHGGISRIELWPLRARPPAGAEATMATSARRAAADFDLSVVDLE